MNQMWIGKIFSQDQHNNPIPLELRESKDGKPYIYFTMKCDSGVEGSKSNPQSSTGRNYNYSEFVNVTVFGQISVILKEMNLKDGSWFVANNGIMVKRDYSRNDGSFGSSLRLEHVNVHLNYIRELNKENQQTEQQQTQQQQTEQQQTQQQQTEQQQTQQQQTTATTTNTTNENEDIELPW